MAWEASFFAVSFSAVKQRLYHSESLLNPALQSTEHVFVASHVVSDSGAQSPLASGRGGCSQSTMQVVGQPSAQLQLVLQACALQLARTAQTRMVCF